MISASERRGDQNRLGGRNIQDGPAATSSSRNHRIRSRGT
ncbi:hypothetical protein Pd630_LPD04027 [Rhodococcus opacus PD630]|nr:hypothetical protein Pd630_LPD04027 [Rhodococcus opacus PD630]